MCPRLRWLVTHGLTPLSVLVDLVDDALAEVTYNADLAGLCYSVTNQIEGLTVSVSGYNDKIPVLLRIVLEKIRGLQVQPDRLRVVKEEVRSPLHSHKRVSECVLSRFNASMRIST